MQLTCPTCRSGLQVPDGTTANVRCPTCRTIFPASEGVAPAPPPPPPSARKPVPAKPAPSRPAPDDEDDRPRRGKSRPRDEDEDDRPRKRRRDDEDEDEEDRPRRTRRAEDEDEDDRPRDRRGRDEVEKKPRKRRRYDADDDDLSPEERRRRADAFARGMWASRLILTSLVFYALSLVIIPIYYILWSLTKETMSSLLVAAGVFGLINWALGAVGLGLAIAGPVSPGHYRFSIAAAVVLVVHLVFLFAQVNRGEGFGVNKDLNRSVIRWMQVPTQFDSLTFYLSYVVYPDDIPIRRADTGLSFLTGVTEMCRLVLILMTLSGLALAAGDRDLSNRCTRVAGRASLVPGALALVMLMYKVVMIETGADAHGYVPLFALVLQMGIYMVPAWMLLGAATATRDVAEACEFPYQSEVIDLGG